MKTKLTTIFKKSANTPPMWVCLLFALVFSTNSWADVTAEWGEWGSPVTHFPIGSEDNQNGIILTPSASITALSYVYVGGIDNNDTYNMNVSGKYVDISLSSGVISSVQFGVWTADATLLKIQFCKEATYTGDPADLLGDPQVMHDAVQAGSGLQTIIAPTNAKSARIYKDGSDHWQCYLYRLIVTAAAGCASPETATFAKGDATSGSVDAIEACEGSSFTMPNQGSMFKPGYLFTGWKLNNAGDLITAGTSYTMPAGGASFTAQWEEDNTTMRIPTTETTLNSENKTGGSSETIDFYDETSVYLYNTHYVEWDAYITPGSYQISMKYGAPYYGIRGTFSIIDPLGIESPRVFYTQIEETNGSKPIYRNPSVTYDLSSLTEGKIYTIKVEHDWSGSYLSIAHIEFTPLGGNHDITFAKGDASVTGTLPESASCAEDGSYTLPEKGDLAWSGHSFAGWSDGSNTYAPGASYTMPNHDVTFTAQWTPMTVPTVTNLTIGEAVDKEVPLSWSIPGICDLSSAVNATVTPSSQHGTGYQYVEQQSYNETDNYITVSGRSVQWSQYGAGFDIPATTGLEWISYEYKGYHDDISIWGGACDGTNAYWQSNTLKGLNDNSNWMQSGVEIPNIIYWDGTMDGAITSKTISQIAIYANAGNGTYDDVSFSIRNVRYHLTGQEDIDHVIVVRKDGSAPENATDGTVYNVGTKSHFLDNDNTKEFGHTYYYSVYAVHADGTLSEATTTSHTIVETPTCNITFNIGEGAIGDAPDDIAKKQENSVVTLPSIGSAYKPFCAFTGWKKNNAGDLLAAGATYTVTAEDVTAETISFTAQWEEDNTTLRIPADASLYWENKTGGSNDTKDFNNEKCVDLYTTHNVEWLAYITPGYYDISMIYGAPYYGIRGTFSIIDPSGVESDRVFYTQTDETNNANSITKSIDIMNYDLTGLKKGKLYKIKVEHNWGGSYLCIGHINFTPVTPEEIASETVLDANNTVTTGLTEVTDVDFPGDNDQSVNLYNKKMDWVVKIAKGYYNISLLYGAPEYSTRVSVALIDPEGVEPTRWFCPDQADRNGHYHYTSGTQGTQYYSIGAGKYNLNNIDPEKTYIVRVHDEYNGSNQLRVKNLTFTLLEPIEIENEVVLNAANSITPNIAMATSVDFTGDSNPDEAMNLRKGGSSPGTNPVEWEVTIARGIYNLALEFGTYSGSGNSLRAKVELIDPSSVESDKVLMTKYVSSSNFSSNQYVEIALGACAFTSVIEDKKYIIRVSDNSDPGSYCSLLVRSLTFTPVAPVEIPSVTRLDATNVFDAPGIVDSRIDIKNRQEAVWYANMMPYVYDINLHYTVASGDTKVRFGIIDVESGDTAFVHQQNKYGAGTYTISVPGQDLRSAITAGKMYKIIVKDNYANNGSVPQIDYLEIVHHAEIHTRTGLTVGNYGTICLPYAVAAEDRNGADLFEIDKWDPNGASLTLSQLTDDENMVAGRPYIFQATAATATFRYYAEGDETEAGEHNGLVGSYEQALIPQNEDNYIIYNNKLYLVNSDAYVGANRAYIHKQDQVQPAPAYRRRVTLSVNGAQVATDIDLINDPAQMTKYIENGHLFIFRDGKLYNAQGQLVK